MRQLDRRGSNAIEFALTLPVFVILFSGMIDFSWYFFSGWRVSSAVREGVRVGSLTPISEDPEAEAEAAAEAAGAAYDLNWGGGTPKGTVIGSGGALSCGIEVLGEASVPPLIGIVPYIPNKVSYTAEMRLEDQSCP